jgi:PrtD family type I secretion system ABC transporter
VLGSRSIPTLVALTLLIVVLFGFAGLIDMLRGRMTARIAALVHDRLAANAFRQAIRVGGTGKTDPVRDLDMLRGFIASPAPVALMDLPWLPVYLVIVFLLHPLLGWIAVGGSGVMVALLLINERLAQGTAARTGALALERQRQLEDMRSNAEVIAAMGMGPAVAARWQGAADQLSTAQLGGSDQTAFFSSFGKSFRMLLQSGVLAAGAFLVIVGQMSPGLILAASVITARALAPVEQVIAHWKGFVAARQALARIRQWPAATTAPATALPRPRRTLAVQAATVANTADRRVLVADVNFEISAGQGLGIIGVSGAGKSSLARALVGVWPLARGTIRLDGAEVSQYDPATLGRSIGYLPQDVELFEGTVAQNIARFEPNPDSGEVLLAATGSGTHQLITQLPLGYDTPLGPRGMTLSAGQRQRIGLARALYRDPFLLVLDEPNANLDGEGEAALIAAVGAARARGAIVVIIAHRPSAITAVDKLLYLNAGRQILFGDRDEVLQKVLKQPAAIEERRRA